MINNLKIGRNVLISIGHYVLMLLLVPVFLTPIVFMFVSSLKPDLQILRDTNSLRILLPVGDLSLDNYRRAFYRAPIARFIFNSVMVTSLTVVLGLFVNSIAAYAFTFLHWKGKGIVLTLIVATLIVPFESIAIPLLLIVSRLPSIGVDGFSQGWLNSYHVQIIPFVANAFSIFLFVQFFRSLPYDLVESARIDGANWFQIYRRVIIPLSGSVLSTVTIVSALSMWNQYLWPLMVIQPEEYRTVMLGAQYFYQYGGEIMAYLSMITLPVLTLFLVLQNAFIDSIATSGIKG